MTITTGFHGSSESSAGFFEGDPSIQFGEEDPGHLWPMWDTLTKALTLTLSLCS
jgi:hypothetical protein